MPEGLFWINEEVETLKRLWETRSASEIGALMGKTRNAVIGKANRLGLPHKRDAPKEGRKPRVRTERKAKPRVARLRIAPTLVPTVAPVPVEGGLHIMELERRHCREVVGYGYPDLLARYCGHEKREGSSFCPYHHSKNYYVTPVAGATQR